MSESDNLATAGTDTAVSNALSLEDAAGIDFFDPSEDNEEVEAEQPESLAEEAGDDESEEPEEIEADAEGDDDPAEDEDEEPAEDADNPEPSDDVTVTINGEQVALSDLKAGYMRQADYSRKTQEVANTRRNLEAMSARVETTVNAIADFLVKQIPEAPDPQLAMTNPGEFVQRKAMHEAAVQQVNALLSQAGEVKDVANKLTDEQRKDLLMQENAKLAEAFPQTATDEGRQEFFSTASTAAKELGYSDEEIQAVADSRMFALAHYAAIGMKAEKARDKAKAKVVNAPPVAPQKQRQQGGKQAAARKNKEAMKRLARSGSIHDAMQIDWD